MAVPSATTDQDLAELLTGSRCPTDQRLANIKAWFEYFKSTTGYAKQFHSLKMVHADPTTSALPDIPSTLVPVLVSLGSDITTLIDHPTHASGIVVCNIDSLWFTTFRYIERLARVMDTPTCRSFLENVEAHRRVYRLASPDELVKTRPTVKAAKLGVSWGNISDKRGAIDTSKGDQSLKWLKDEFANLYALPVIAEVMGESFKDILVKFLRLRISTLDLPGEHETRLLSDVVGTLAHANRN